MGLRDIRAPRWLTGLWSPVEERLNPILVKEMRQALRGRAFRIVFWIAVAIATTVGCLILVQEGEQPSEMGGLTFFVALYGFLSAAVHLFVPFAAFQSVGAEWEENTFDLLVLSNLRPRQIVLGKLLSHGLLVLLFFSGFVPFLLFAFLLRGLDLVGAVWVLGLTLISSTALICLAIALSSMTRQKLLRVVAMVVLAVPLFQVTIGSIGFSGMWLSQNIFHTPAATQALLAGATFGLTVIAFACAFAATRFAHPEENRSTVLRVMATIAVLIALVWGAHLVRFFGDLTPLAVLCVPIFIGLTFFATSFATEEERLGRRVRHQVPRNRMLALLATPYFPGGGRGLLFYGLHAFLIVGGVLAIARWSGVTSIFGSARTTNLWLIPWTLFAYGAIYVGFVTWIGHFFSSRITGRIGARLGVPVAAVLGLVLPIIVGFLSGTDGWVNGRHPGNPAWVIEDVTEHGFTTTLYALSILGAVCLSLNVARVWRGWREVLAASTARRASSEAVAGLGLPPQGSDALPDA